ncbi:S8 family serine peptidase [Sphingomonas sp. S2-65]|uniref:S8 family serine peptidase n=1 Tax=Sphingomonas sp. S2-65 TaxID=2903960 RepID=UPI001F334AAE|nr:S8 family serine peptidase [Sphingomonas sp. S2-65]UYY57169.1 S8 family serine peptidase [Sphingomonas sp. S2-65]
MRAGYILLWSSAALLAPESPRAEVVTVEFSGNNAPELAAQALTRLVREHPDLILDPTNTTDNIEQVRAVCGPQSELKIVLRGCYFWDKIVASGGWPANTPQIERIPALLRAPGKDRHYLPKVRWDVFDTVGEVSVPSNAAHDAALAPEQVESVCHGLRWNNRESGSCVIDMIAPEDSGGEASGTRRLVVRRRTIQLSLDVPEVRAPAVRGTLARATVVPVRGAIGTLVAPPVALRSLFGAAQETPAGCPAARIASAAAAVRTAIAWPAGATRIALPRNMLAVLDGEAGNTIANWVSTSRMRQNDWEGEGHALALHPMLADAPGWQLACADWREPAPGGPFSHSFAVASVITGQATRVDTGASAVEIAPLFEFGPVNIGAVRMLQPPNINFPGGTPVFVASYQQEPPPAQPGSTPGKPIVGAYAAKINTTMQAGAVIVAAAPEQNDHGATADTIDTTDNFTCYYWPSCLGSLGWVLTVAAVDNAGALIEASPSSGRKYDLTPRTIMLAAAGEDVPVLARGERPGLAFASGTSVAAPAVAALALRMRGSWTDPRNAYDIVTTIQASADLTRNFGGRIRFGQVNASRALAVNALKQGEALAYGATGDERTDAASPSAPLRIRGRAKSSQCDVSEQDASQGVLYYYLEGDEVPEADGEGVTRCVAVKKLLRLRWSGNDGGHNRYILVYQADKLASKRPFATIERDVLLDLDGVPGRCRPALGTANLESMAGACLAELGSDDTPRPIDLIGRDLVFNPLNRQEH